MKEKQKRLKYLPIVLIISLLIFLFYIYGIPKDTVDAYLTVGDHLGFNVDTSAIYFATVPSEGVGERMIHIKNERCNLCVVDIKVKGSLADWISISENNFILKKGEIKDIKVTATVPKNAKFGDYNATLTIYYIRKLF